ncbi:hypothetical protein J1N35_007867 [Gossypium stocksii]|uniref:Aminotransferase-like plant mobile domain-containing protein n=1 Tax=Gossypium stocksii TaxID=47602 RepID=A0A9D3W6U9_9ROSI|nr:hypothetical protein J1N35_007867 [Gossypium stocksii]
MPIPRALSSDKAKYKEYGQLLPLAVVMGVISDAIFGINEPPTKNIAALIPSWVHEQQILFVTKVSLISFNMVEWHTTDCVLRQFGCMQHILDPPQDFKHVHGIEKKGKDAKNWATEYAPYIILWNTRHERHPLVYI